MSWTLTADGQWYLFEGAIRMPVDPTTGAAIIMLRPQGGMSTVPAVEQGAPGVHAQIEETINFTSLAHDDPTPNSASFTTLTPPTESTPGIYQLNLAVKSGEPGADGTTAIDLSSIGGTPTTDHLIKVNATADGFDFTPQKVASRHIPATINNTAAGNPNSTLTVVSVGALNFDWRPLVTGYTVITGTGSDVMVDLVARLDGETGGNIVAHCPGITSTERLMFAAGPPAGSADGFDKVLAGNAATIHVRTERQTGADTYTTSAATSRFTLWVIPVS